MRYITHINKRIIFGLIFFFLVSLLYLRRAEATTMQDYCILPPFVSQSVPPLVMLAMGRDHKVFYEAYNDAYDMDEDKRIDDRYKHSIDYYGYFDPYRCYTYNSGGTSRFVPLAAATTDKFCAAGQWSGNVLNYLTMSKMDVIRKVFYGGHRVSASSNVLERAYIPQDAHSWGKEFTGRLCYNASASTSPVDMRYTNQCVTDTECDTGYACTDKSVNLIGIAASTAPVDCVPNPVAKVCSGNGATACTTNTDCLSAGGTCSLYTRTGQILLAKYNHSSSKTAAANANNHANLVASYEPANIVGGSLTYITDFNAAALNPNQNHGANYNYFLITQFQVTAGNAGTWNFAIDGNEAVEVEIDGAVVVGWYGAHTYCNCKTHTGSVALSAGWHTLIVRHFENPDTGSTSANKDGVNLFYDLPGGATTWVAFGNTLTLRSPDIDPGGTGNYCSIMTSEFIEFGTPNTSTFTYGTAKYHLFCNTSLGDGPSFPPLLRLVTDRDERIWLWASKERPVCNSPGTSGYPFGSTIPTDYAVRVESCTTTEAANKTDFFKNYCRDYPAGSGSGYMPAGLMQKYGEGDGTKICSKQFTKPCNTDSDCGSGEGKCMDRTKMFFGLITGSYTKNLSGGVLRKNVWSIMDEIESNNGSFQGSQNVQGNIILDTLETMKTIGFQYSSGGNCGTAGYCYNDCGWITTHAMNEGECKMWGNPMAEIMYEATRYFADKGTPTSDFMYSTTDDSGLGLSKLGTSNKPWITPYQQYPWCARPFILVFSDISPSYDSDQVPGSYFNSFSGDLTGLDVSTFANTIGTTEGIAGTNRFIGRSGSTEDFLCTSKSVSNLGSVRGICPEEPTKQGSFYSSAVAYYGKDKLKVCSNNSTTICTSDADCTSPGTCVRKNLTTYSVALSSPVPDVNLKIGGKNVRFVPTGKSVNGGYSVDTACNCTFTRDTNGLHISNCASGAYCPTNQIVDFYVDTITYDSDNNLTYAKFRINFEDVEQGADHDMDAIVTYEIEPNPDNPTNEINISLTSDYAAGSIVQALGFIITGTTEDGVYLPVRDVDTPTSDSRVGALPLNWQKTFTITGAATEVLKDPLWYAAKWGGFEDTNNNEIPDLQVEWDENNDGTPDNYFLVVNPLKMERQLEDALLSILRRASSGTAASVLASGEGSGANLVQAVFYPKRMFNKEIDWSGTLQNLWYYVDPLLYSSSIRENTVEDSASAKDLKIDQDYIVNFFFDNADQRTKAKRYSSDANGVKGAQQTTVLLEELKYLWEAGSLLHSRDLGTDPRTIYTTTDGVTRITFDSSLGTATTLQSYLNASSPADAQNIISYVRGESDIDTDLYRDRRVTNGTAPNQINQIWKLGDIVSSTPRVVSWIGLNDYQKRYDDLTYSSFLNSDYYKYRGKVIGGTPYGNGMVFTGANDGMLHAFNLGSLEVVNDTTSKKATLRGADMGREEWAFIPENSLPYLKYLMDKDYCHLYFIDASPYIFDASIEPPSPTGNYWDLTRTVDSWRTILIGGMRVGGACRAVASTYGVQAPAAGEGYSSYFALDITDTLAHPGDLVNHPPQLLWEFSRPADRDLGFTTTGPTIVKISAREEVSGVSIPKDDKDGRWFVVFASGPTGPIDTAKHEFKGYSDQNLKLFILDLKTGALATPPIDTGITNAFGSSLNGASIDYDLDYQDDAFYLGYTKAEYIPVDANTKWTSGGVIRVITREDLNGTNVSAAGTTALNPGNWLVSDVITGIGPVTSSIGHLAHYPTKSKTPDKGWLYFGTGRYFFREDDISTARTIFGVKELCLSKIRAIDDSGDPVCGSSDDFSGVGDLDNVTTTVPSTESPNGWYINLDPAERVITDPLASTTGAVFFTTFAPSSDICEYGGSTYLWAVKHDTGGSVASSLKGTALIQVSTGVIEEIALSSSFTQKVATNETIGRRTAAMQGVPPIGQGLAILTQPPPVKRTIHMRER